jgi:hypothetical protein
MHESVGTGLVPVLVAKADRGLQPASAKRNTLTAGL